MSQPDHLDDPMAFVLAYCREHGLPDEVVLSEPEQRAHARASDARERYKSRRNALESVSAASSAASPAGEGGRGIGVSVDAAKYKTRLRNNRKSAHASKVFREVLRRELSHFCHSACARGALAAEQRLRSVQASLLRERHGRHQCERDLAELRERKLVAASLSPDLVLDPDSVKPEAPPPQTPVLGREMHALHRMHMLQTGGASSSADVHVGDMDLFDGQRQDDEADSGSSEPPG